MDSTMMADIICNNDILAEFCDIVTIWEVPYEMTQSDNGISIEILNEIDDVTKSRLAPIIHKIKKNFGENATIINDSNRIKILINNNIK